MGSKTVLSGHFLLLAAPGWGHIRPLCAFAGKVVQENPNIAITFLTVGGFAERSEREVDRYLSGDGDNHLKARIRIINIGGKGFDPFELMPILFGGFEDFYKKLINKQPIQCTGTGQTYSAIGAPTAAVIDYFALPIVQAIRSLTGKDIPVFAWAPANASMLLRIFGPEKLGGLGDVASKARAEAERTGRAVEEVTEELYRPQHGELIKVPGLPLMYDYEWSPQEPLEAHPQNDLFSSAYSLIRDSEGVISITSSIYEPESIDALRGWLSETNRQIFSVGPLVPEGSGGAGLSGVAKKKELDSSENADEFQVFLDRTLQSHGEKSIIYISFGSFWWPKNEYVLAFINTLLELGFPFILSHPSQQAAIPPSLIDKVKKSGLGLLSAWSPQQTILNHPATGWILTHCGQNSVTEALAQGIPMIAWPIDADQPANAAYLTLTLDVAFELVEVRTGLGLKRLYRGVQPAGTVNAVVSEARDVLERARGPEGERKRRNVEALRDRLKGEWEEGGDGQRNLRNLLNSLA